VHKKITKTTTTTSRASNFEDSEAAESSCAATPCAPLFHPLPQSSITTRQAVFTNFVDDDDRIIFGGCTSSSNQSATHQESHVVNRRSGSFPNLLQTTRPVVTQKTITTTNLGTGETTKRYIKQTSNVAYTQQQQSQPATTITRTTVYTPLSYQYEPLKLSSGYVSNNCESFNQSFNSRFNEVFGQQQSQQQQQQRTVIQQHTPLFFEPPKTERYFNFW
jgi:hypothetical protein